MDVKTESPSVFNDAKSYGVRRKETDWVMSLAVGEVIRITDHDHSSPDGGHDSVCTLVRTLRRHAVRHARRISIRHVDNTDLLVKRTQ